MTSKIAKSARNVNTDSTGHTVNTAKPRRYRLKGRDVPADERTAGVMAASPIFCAAGVMAPIQGNQMGDKATADSLMLALDERIQHVHEGDLSEVEAMLLAQATALQSLFTHLTRRASTQQHVGNFQTMLSLGMKAQAQSRATLEALIEMKQPRHAPTFVKQANIAHGHQQVNNGAETFSDASTRAREEAEDPQNKLLEVSDEQQWLDAGTPAAAGRKDPHLEAVGAIHRAKKRRG